uniref:Glycoside hydrolase 123 catalytic domain-containing protein n=1 Tax=Oryza meridionalis TaxID=40149 RepID=A0A0E0EDM4_9ORYZ
MESGQPNSAAADKTQNSSVPPVEGVAGGGTSYGWVDGGLQASSLGNGAIDPTKIHSADLLHVWSMPSTANVSQQEAPRPLEHVNLLAARNERESFQIALRPKVSWATSGIAGSVQVQCTDLCSSAGDRETSAIWVSLNVPCGQQPGLYEGEIFISAVRAEAESRGESLTKSERYQLYKELRNCIDITEPRDYSSSEEMVQRLTSASTTLRRMLALPSFQDCEENNGLGDMMDEDIMNNVAVRPSGSELAPSTFEAFVKVPNVLRPHTQIFCTSEWVLGTREDLVKDIVAELRPDLGEEWWTYVCMGPSDPQPNWHLGMRGTQHRAVMWRVWKEGGTGFLYWGTNCYEKAMIPSAEICFRRGLPPGDGVLFYPGEVFSSSHEPVASTRLERILSGMQDIEYLKLYSSRYGREEGLALLEKTGVYLGPDRYALDHGPIDVMRGEVAIQEKESAYSTSGRGTMIASH